MAQAQQQNTFPDWDRATRPPVPPPPPKSCDCQFHIYGNPAKYPPKKDAFYQPPDATFDDMRSVLATLDFQRGVIVHPMPYGADHRLLIDALSALPPAERDNFRATCILEDSVTDADMAALNALGVRGARFNIGKRYRQSYTEAQTLHSLARAREIGWHARLHVGGDDILAYGDFLRAIKDITIVVDHMAHLDFTLGLEQPALTWMLNQIRHEGWWMMLSNGNRDSRQESGYDDAVPFGKALIAAAPERMIWGSDWPHVNWRKRMMNDAETVELLYRYVDHDKALLQAILVDNPARLHGFPA